MSKNRFVYVIITVAVVVGLIYVWQGSFLDAATTKQVPSNTIQNQVAKDPLETNTTFHTEKPKENALSKEVAAQQIQEKKGGTETKLTISNFEGFVGKCFHGETCDFGDDPIAMYKYFKRSGNERACDSLIAFLRKQMKETTSRKRYKDVLKKMIDDFYPPEEKQFQEAAYYNYSGDLQKSLDLYLDLELKSQTDSSLRPAPKLNIANTFYDMKRYRDSLPYYEAALQEFISNGESGAVPGRNEMIRFVEGRIEDVKKHL
ncbi:MAG: hypothetical protein AABZ31_02940 [Bdellovibrionota bacterium]